MASIHLALQIIRQTLAGPAFWSVVGAAWIGWWGLEHLLPLGLTTGQTHRLAAHYEIAFMAGAIGASLTAARLTRYDALLRRLSGPGRAATEWGSCVAVAVLAASALVVPAHSLRQWQLEEFRASASYPALLASIGHLAAILAASQRVPSRDRLTPVAAAVAVAIVLPGLLAGDSAASSGLLALIDCSAPLRTSFDFPADGAHWMRGALPTLGWGLVAAALASPRPERAAPRLTP